MVEALKSPFYLPLDFQRYVICEMRSQLAVQRGSLDLQPGGAKGRTGAENVRNGLGNARRHLIPE